MAPAPRCAPPGGAPPRGGQPHQRRAGALRAMRRAPAASGSAHGEWRAVLLRRARAPRTHARPALMQAPQRYPELFLAPPERAPDSFWISLGYFNLYRL